MNYNDLILQWKYEEDFAFQGWDFSHINGRWMSEPLPWDYRTIVLSILKSTDNLLDMGTGGGEFLMSLKHPFALTSVTEAHPPNVELCKKKLAPHGITVMQTYDDDKLPFQNDSFDIVINRHESFDPAEVGRVLKKGGYFITQQVGGENDRDLSQRLIKDFTPVRFFDIGALVYFAKIVEWEFPNFSVNNSLDSLCQIQKEIEKKGFVQGKEHRFIIVAQKT